MKIENILYYFFAPVYAQAAVGRRWKIGKGRFVQISADISERAAIPCPLLADPSAQLDSVYKTVPLGIAMFDRDLRCLRINEMFAEFIGTPAGEYVGQSLRDFGSELADPLMSSVLTVLRTGQPVVGLKLRDGIENGAERTFSFSFHPLLDADNIAIAVNCFMQEITEHVRDSQAVREQLCFVEFLADLTARFVPVASEEVDAQVHDGLRRLVEFLGVDRSGLARITVNREASIISSFAVPGTNTHPTGQLGEELKWYVNEIASGRIVQFSRVDQLPPAAEMCKRYARNTGMKSHIAIPIPYSDEFIYGLGIATLREEKEFPEETIPHLRLIGRVFSNALGRRDADAKLRLMQTEVSHVTRVSTIGQLAASIAHEINQPLCSIVNNAQAALRLLASDSPDLAEIADSLRDIAAGGKRAGEVVARSHELLKRRELQFAPLCLNAVIRDVALLIRSDALIKGATLDLDLTDPLPKVSGDRVQLQQVVLNLLINAMDATANVADGVRRVEVRTVATNSHVCVTVCDTGVGLSPEVAPRMFEPFFTTKRSGLGMGLAINQTIVESHGGRIWAAPNPDRGASISFELQRRPEASS